jgi:Xaa-Pro aminopeptidase
MTEIVKKKIGQACGILKEFDTDCWLTFVRETQLNGDPILPFLAGVDMTWHSALILCSSGRTIAIVGAYDKKTLEDTGAYGEVIGYVEGIKSDLLRTLQSINPRTIAVNYSEGSEVCDGLTHGMYLTLVHLLAEIGFEDKLVSAEKIISALRQRKTAVEIGSIRQAIAATEDIFGKVTGFIRPGVAEIEIADFMRNLVAAAGLVPAWEPRICPSVFTGPETAQAHYGPTDRKVERGHILNMDFGVIVHEYCSDLQRTFYIREEKEQSAPPEVMKGFQTIVEAVEMSKRALKPGVRGLDIDRIAREIIVAAGYESFPHALGHQVGRFAHDGTALLGPAWEKYVGKPFELIEKGMVFTLEPRLTVPGRGVVTIEEMVLVMDDGAEYLSTPQKELLMV